MTPVDYPMPDYDYKQLAKTPEYLKHYSEIFSNGIMDNCILCGTPVSPTSGVFYPTYAKCINCAYEESNKLEVLDNRLVKQGLIKMTPPRYDDVYFEGLAWLEENG